MADFSATGLFHNTIEKVQAVLRGGEATAEGCVVCLFSSLLLLASHNSTSTSLKTLLSATL